MRKSRRGCLVDRIVLDAPSRLRPVSHRVQARFGGTATARASVSILPHVHRALANGGHREGGHQPRARTRRRVSTRSTTGASPRDSADQSAAGATLWSPDRARVEKPIIEAARLAPASSMPAVIACLTRPGHGRRPRLASVPAHMKVALVCEPPDGGAAEHVAHLARGLLRARLRAHALRPARVQAQDRARCATLAFRRDYRHPHEDASPSASCTRALGRSTSSTPTAPRRA